MDVVILLVMGLAEVVGKTLSCKLECQYLLPLSGAKQNSSTLGKSLGADVDSIFKPKSQICQK